MENNVDVHKWDLSRLPLTPAAYRFLSEIVERLYFAGLSFSDAMDRVTGLYAKN